MPNAGEPEPLYVSIGDAIRAVRGAMSQPVLADAIGKNQRTLSAYEDGRVRTPLHVIPAIEEACGARKGTVLRLAGLVDDDVEAVIQSDPALTEKGRDTVLSYYRFVRDDYDENR